MYQLFATIIAFLCIPILIRFKFKLSKTLLITALVLGMVSGIGIINLKDAFLSVITDKSSLSTILTVAMVTILSGLMKQYRILDKIVESMLIVINNKKVILMIIPAMIGMLIVPGGALLSAPFINNLGEEMGIKQSRRAAINLVFRHISMFILPYSTSLLIISGSMPQINIGQIILLNLIFVISMIIIGYFMFIRDIDFEKSIEDRKDIGKNIVNLIVHTSPIYVCVILNVLTGLPFYITLIGSIILVFLLGDKEDFFRHLIKSFNLNTVLIVIAVFIIKGIILRMDDLLQLFNTMFLGSDSVFSIMIVFFISSFFFGFITGNQTASLAILLPMVTMLNVSNETLYVYLYFSYCCAFLGYFFSPLHLCQAFTVQHMGVATKDLYKEYKYFPVYLVLVLMISFMILV
ncbi:DUF401 family protein [Tissierella sp. Yu-01]|uniref:DUF401 family protein n=1 Tax=Tissierella sp. Yu-01 TaxID=3035694 RepID=UPI00240DD628|nr:DUF401 family protein [Tissierella sp. Yu-01]WFA08646.1 DUF401 family protein [Tissierella sp. Yu-01]